MTPTELRDNVARSLYELDWHLDNERSVTRGEKPVDLDPWGVIPEEWKAEWYALADKSIALILGEAWLFRSIGLAEYAVLVLILFHLFVVLYEEPTLESLFGESYRAYRRAVPRWGFTTRSFQESTGSTA